jgi:hypothetical protein
MFCTSSESAMQKPIFGLIATGAPADPSGATANRPNCTSGKWKCPWGGWKTNVPTTGNSLTIDHVVAALWVYSR